ncbi:hypothetical protein HHK36_000654 [Tetracentron sinense]|uniref:Uncharacterized protein n=1 Tax=Tetracentron sinense TaxID=13715 RepID=A0A835A1E7_TETSI|nr:hypothetical protein HHK36_000654 [Tetracentron sinense]
MDIPRIFSEIGTGIHSSPSSTSRSSIAANSCKKGSVGEAGREDIPIGPASRSSSCFIIGLFCALFVNEDCCKHGGPTEQQTAGENSLFCTLCNAEGITTYEYIVVMRAMNEASAGESVDEEMPNVLYSPTGSATTGLSGGRSLALQYKEAWCTPPRIFVDYQDEVIPQLEPGMIPSRVDPNATGFAERGSKLPKRPVRISAWKLAKLDSNEAMRAAIKARVSSSVLRPVGNRSLPNLDFSSIGNMSGRSSMSTEMGGNKETKNELRLLL